MIDLTNARRARATLAGLALLVLAMGFTGCANSGVTTRAVVELAGGVTDAELYHESKVAGDRVMRSNLRDAWHELTETQAELAIEQAVAVDGAAVEVARGRLRSASAALDAALDAQAKVPAEPKDAADAAAEAVDAAQGRVIAAEATLSRAMAGAIPKGTALDVARKLTAKLRTAGKSLEDIAEAQAAAETHYQGLRSTLKGAVSMMRALADREAAEQHFRETGAEAGQAAVDAAKKLGAGAAGGPVGAGILGVTR